MACMKTIPSVLSFSSQEGCSEIAVILITQHDCVSVLFWQVAVEDIIADGRLRLAVQTVFDETQLAAALQVTTTPVHVNGMLQWDASAASRRHDKAQSEQYAITFLDCTALDVSAWCHTREGTEGNQVDRHPLMPCTVLSTPFSGVVPWLRLTDDRHVCCITYTRLKSK